MATNQHFMKGVAASKEKEKFLRHADAEDFELSEYAKAELILARATPEDRYIRHEDLKKELSE